LCPAVGYGVTFYFAASLFLDDADGSECSLLLFAGMGASAARFKHVEVVQLEELIK
jgi:hypothetical protein